MNNNSLSRWYIWSDVKYQSHSKKKTTVVFNDEHLSWTGYCNHTKQPNWRVPKRHQNQCSWFFEQTIFFLVLKFLLRTLLEIRVVKVWTSIQNCMFMIQNCHLNTGFPKLIYSFWDPCLESEFSRMCQKGKKLNVHNGKLQKQTFGTVPNNDVKSILMHYNLIWWKLLIQY